MKKLMIISNSPIFGGAEGFILSTLTALEKNYNVSYVVANKHLAERLNNKPLFYLKSKNLLKQFFELKSVLKSINPDIILFNGASLFYFAPFLKRYHTILYRHSTNSYSPPSRRWLYKIIMSLCYKNVNLTIHVSNLSSSEQHVGNKKVIHNGINIPNTTTYSKLHLPLKVLYCSRLEQSKGIIDIVEAFKGIDKNIANLTIIGDGSLKDWVSANCSSSIQYLGFQDNVSKFYKSHNILILMSEFENFPLSILEALSHGLPIITTGAGGIKEAVMDNVNGWIIEKTPSNIKDCILHLSENLSEVEIMSQNARKYCIENFNIENCTKEIIKTIENSYSHENRN